MAAFSPMDVVLTGFVSFAAVTDLGSRRISNVLVLCGMLAALQLHVQHGDYASLKIWLGGMLTGFLVLLPFYLVRGMAAGDVKLMAMVGAFTGPALVLQISLATFLTGGVMALAIVLARRRLRDVLRNLQCLALHALRKAQGLPVVASPLAPGISVGSMPYGLAIAVGTLLSLYLRDA